MKRTFHIFCAIVFILGNSTLGRGDKTKPYQAASNADEALTQLNDLGAEVRWLTLAEKELEVDFRFCGNSLADSHLQYLHQLPVNIAVVRLKNTPIGDGALTHLAQITGIRRLHLDGTKVTDEGLGTLSKLQSLTFLSLSDTTVTDAALPPLAKLAKLKQLHLSETQVSEEGIAKLQKDRPEILVTPDLPAERRKAQIIWEVTKVSLARSREDLVQAEKDFKELSPLAEGLKKKSEEFKKKTDAAKKAADTARKEADGANSRADELRRHAEDLARKLKKKPEDN